MPESGKVAVVGATGRVGRHVVDVLNAQGHDVVPIARANGVDVISGAGLEGALEGVACVIDAGSGPSSEQEAATAWFTTEARNLLGASERAGVRRIVVVSIIGCDRFKAGYSAAKFTHEQAMRSGPIPARILRAAQFHEFVGQLVDWGRRGEVSYLPRMRTQLVAARSVAEALVDLALAGDPAPAGAPILEIAGPRAETLADAATLLVTRRGDPVRIQEVSHPDDPDRELYETGGLLPGPNAILAGPTFAEWLEATA
jgi:uncharacterized protein YbjT (DUF2867 family)